MTAGDGVKDGTAAHSGCSGACGCARLDDDGGTDRRAFLAQGAAAIAALALAACGLGVPTAPGSVSATTIKLSDYPSLANVGGVVVTQISGNPIAIVHETSTTFSAFSLICPHAGNTVQSEGTQGFYCPGHGARFSLAGQWTGGQPTGNLTSYPVRYDATAGSLTVGS